MFNPFQMMNVAKNQQQLMLEQIKNQNPELYKKAQEMIAGKSEDELKQLANNIAQQRGINLSQFANQFGIKL